MALKFLRNSCTAFLTTSVFTALGSLLKSTGAISNLSVSNFSVSDFKLAKSAFLADFEVSKPVAFFNLDLDA